MSYFRPTLARKLNTLALICLTTSFAGVIFQLIKELRLDFSSVLFGFPLGLVFGILELFLFPMAESRFRQWSFTKLLIIKTLVYTAIIFVVTVGLSAIDGMVQGQSMSELWALLVSPDEWILIFYTLVVYSLLNFFIQVNRLLGEGILWKFITGKYHKPREEERIFMFLDMKSSTTIAEQLGHVRFYSLLDEVFHEISQPVLETKAEIYQYVGDEVVLTWPMEHGLKNSNCLKTFFMFQDNLERNKENYLVQYGIQPEFKAGLHFGKVVSAQIGDLKREIVYNGDVVNTTSRIQNECKTYQRNCLVSGVLKNRLHHENGYQWERIESVALRGKETEVELFSVVNTT